MKCAAFACLGPLFSTPFVPFIDSLSGPHGKGGTQASESSRGYSPSAILPSLDPFAPLSAPWLSSGVCSVSQPAIDYLLSHGTGNLVGSVVGGVGEALQSVPNTTTLILQKRKGFVRVALQHG